MSGRPAGLTGTAQAHCTGCGHLFTSVRAFDQHQRISDGAVLCRGPAKVGLHETPKGWARAAPDKTREADPGTLSGVP